MSWLLLFGVAHSVSWKVFEQYSWSALEPWRWVVCPVIMSFREPRDKTQHCVLQPPVACSHTVSQFSIKKTKWMKSWTCGPFKQHTDLFLFLVSWQSHGLLYMQENTPLYWKHWKCPWVTTLKCSKSVFEIQSQVGSSPVKTLHLVLSWSWHDCVYDPCSDKFPS